MRSRWVLWFIIILTFLAVLVDIPFPKLKILNRSFQINFPLKLGLDLQGGTELILQTVMDKIPAGDRDTALESAKNVIERRVNPNGVSEITVQTAKVGQDRRILIDLPGARNASQAASLVVKVAQLDFREVPATLSAQQQEEASKSGIPVQLMEELAATPTNLTGADLKKAEVTYGGSNNISSAPQVSLEFTDKGAKKFADITRRNIGKPLCIFLDNAPIPGGCPTVQQEIDGGNAVITGQFTVDQAKELAVQLNAGALPVPVKILEQRSIGPTLGFESIKKSIAAGVIGFLIVASYMAAYYGISGLVADLALLIYAALVLAIFKTGLFIITPITLTLAGIAGFILSIGMAVDANILIFERMKEELRWGKTKASALDLGFKRAWSSIWASNVSSLITAFILYQMGQSIVQSFAVTLAIGVLVSMFTSYVVTRTLLRLIIR